ncbi:MAG: hypothetical protein Q7Q73_02835 [Verrucomicrobiota bacterium JB024]|nr:hypothetical protein [Verrucomicrobiota bacterium JB024]
MYPIKKITPLILLLASAASLAASVVVTTSLDQPTDYFASNSTGGAGLQWRNDTINGRRDLGQSFYTDTALSLSAVTYRIVGDSSVGSGALNAAFTLSIYEVASASAVPTAGTAISAQSGTMAGLTGTSADFNKYVTFTMDAPVSLEAEKYYAAILSFDDQVANQNIVWSVSTTTAVYPDGRLVLTTDGTTFTTGNDMVFYVTAIPEPSQTAAMIGLLVVGYVVYRRKFNKRS